MLTAYTRNALYRAREENLVRGGSFLPKTGEECSTAGNPPRKPTREVNKAHEADTPCSPNMTYKTYKSYRTYEVKAAGNCLEFEAKAHHQSSIIK